MFDLSMANVLAAGPLIAFGSVLAGSLGVPIPTLAALIFVGSLMASHGSGFGVALAVLAAAMLGAVIGDIVWFFAGRRYGTAVLSLICRLSLSRDSCVRRTADTFGRRGIKVLLFSRFVPGLSVIAAPLSGISGITVAKFVSYAETGAALWIATGLALGYFFAGQIGAVLATLEHFGLDLGGAAIALIALYAAISWLRRQLLLHQLRAARITPDELAALHAAGEAPAIIDARSVFELDSDPYTLPNALLLSGREVDNKLLDVPRLHSVVVFCSCPNEITAAVVAKRMHKLGFMNVRPLRGGLDAWREAGHPVQSIPRQNRPTPANEPETLGEELMTAPSA